MLSQHLALQRRLRAVRSCCARHQMAREQLRRMRPAERPATAARASWRGTASAPVPGAASGLHPDTAALAAVAACPAPPAGRPPGRPPPACRWPWLRASPGQRFPIGWERQTHRPPHTPWPVRRAAARPASAPADSAAFSEASSGPTPQTTLVPGMSSSQEGLDVLLVGHPADKQRHRPRQRAQRRVQARPAAGRRTGRCPRHASSCADCESHAARSMRSTPAVGTITPEDGLWKWRNSA